MKDKDVQAQINEYLDLHTKLWAFSGSIVAIKDGD